MNREYHRWHSPTLKRDMELLIFGHAGARVLIFPTSQGRFFDWEDRGMINLLAERIDRGEFKLCCVDSVDAESWYDYRKSPHHRAQRQDEYDRYLLNEVLPMLCGDESPAPFLMTTGASFGAYHAASFAFRHPDRVGRMLGMSGLYDIRRFTNNESDALIARNNPLELIAHLTDPAQIAAFHQQDIIFATGWDDSFRTNNQAMAQLLHEKGIPNTLRLWDGWAHDWPWWEKMLLHYIDGHD